MNFGQIDLTQIILAVITLIGAIIARYAIPLIKDKLNARQQELLVALVRTGVYAAEQIYTSEQGQEKKQYVLDFLRKNGYDIDDKAVEGKVSDVVEALIEAMVKELKMSLNG